MLTFPLKRANRFNVPQPAPPSSPPAVVTLPIPSEVAPLEGGSPVKYSTIAPFTNVSTLSITTRR